jgi:hypothetical protein
MNNVLIPRCMCSIFTEGKNSTSEGGGGDREMTVSGPPMLVRSGLLQMDSYQPYQQLSAVTQDYDCLPLYKD